MAFTVSSAYVPPANTLLTPSGQNLAPAPLMDTAQAALADAAPAAVYHPSEGAQTLAQPLEVIDTWVGRSASPELPRLEKLFQGAQSVLKAAVETFKAALPADLAGKKFGFTVEADDRLKVIDTAGQLSQSDIQRLTLLLNQTSDLKPAAIRFRDATIDLLDADSPWSGNLMGYYSLTKENFAATLDLAALFNRPGSLPPKEHAAGTLIGQLANKGQVATQETEAAMLERRAAQRFSVQA
ncbi:hypothetical protein BLL37_04960 [Pseudomonas azotoformans]|uniref:Uncharacterized protein n=1 Tax=Pseudomonas azotoformans TaxID=47878 RepID=A0A1V2JVT7_PSEAZ|nr:hypothetical protein [Pseudomonas azotoformans]OIN52371.1 hypothetical protein BFL39_03540 [Pseudomonas azotoformans]ONH48721.1 hypothetical protein BLL37_04960 [Pseudomonas azotoformans]SDN60064.1 hypothetical protein SAMN04489799_2374 [Pseudomonas azotoformans]